MKIPTKVESAINQQIKEEFDSAYLYLAMSGFVEAKDLTGFAAWLRVQYNEELMHAHKFFDYLFEREGQSRVPSIKEPPAQWNSVREVFEAVYHHEQYITSCIHQLVQTARQENDVATEAFLQWYVNEQVEEEDAAHKIIKKIEMVEESKYGFYMLDREMAERGSIAE